MYSKYSYWEQKSLIGQFDCLIVGSGIVGMTAALYLAQNRPEWRIGILERGNLPFGASSRNAGFACFGSPSEVLDDLETNSEDLVLSIIEKRWRGLTRLRELLGEGSIDYKESGGYELFLEGQDNEWENVREKLPFLNELVERAIGKKNTYLKHGINQYSFGKVTQIVKNQYEGILNPGKMITSLIHKCQQSGISFLNGFELKGMEYAGTGWKCDIGEHFKIDTQNILLATNGFASKFLPELDLKPARAQVILTEKMDKVPFEGGFHLDRGYYYFRNVGNRILFGGGRELDFKGEETIEMEANPLIDEALSSILSSVIFPKNQLKIEYRWSGIMGVGKKKSPIIREIKPGFYCSVRLGGMGVAIGALVGEEAGKLIDSKN